jgi:hypothetical protein
MAFYLYSRMPCQAWPGCLGRISAGRRRLPATLRLTLSVPSARRRRAQAAAALAAATAQVALLPLAAARLRPAVTAGQFAVIPAKPAVSLARLPLSPLARPPSAAIPAPTFRLSVATLLLTIAAIMKRSRIYCIDDKLMFNNDQ